VRLGSVAKTKKPAIAGSVDTVAVAVAAGVAAAAATSETTSTTTVRAAVKTITISPATKRGSAGPGHRRYCLSADIAIAIVYISAQWDATVGGTGDLTFEMLIIWSLKRGPEPKAGLFCFSRDF